jgi:hypothetical protein
MFIKEGKNNELLVTVERWMKDNGVHSKQATQKQENTSFEKINNQSNKQEEFSEKSQS